MKYTNLDIQDAACLQGVNILQLPTSYLTMNSMLNAVVNTPETGIIPLWAGPYFKLTSSPPNDEVLQRKATEAWTEKQSGL